MINSSRMFFWYWCAILHVVLIKQTLCLTNNEKSVKEESLQSTAIITAPVSSFRRMGIDRHLTWRVRKDINQDYGCPKPCLPCTSGASRSCLAGVTLATDGCGCCDICTRQEGEQCNQLMICDPKKDLVCRVPPASVWGYCKRRTGGNGCALNGKLFRDGEMFNSTCRFVCLCQHGRVTCSDTCPHHDQNPDESLCPQANLVSIPGRCCKEWICENSGEMNKPAGGIVSRSSRDGEENVNREVEVARCPVQHRLVTEWSPCSATCGIGTSRRQTNDNTECRTIQQTRLCQIRKECTSPNESEDQCRATIRHPASHKFEYQHENPDGKKVRCVSTRQWKPKYCSNCKKSKCCKPSKIKTKQIEFKCDDGYGRVKLWGWIKRCHCSVTKCSL